MQNVLVPGAVVLLTVVLWLRRKPVKPMLSSTDTSTVAQLNRAQLELVIEPSSPLSTVEDPFADWTPPQTDHERLGLQQRLRERMASGPAQRLEAVREAARGTSFRSAFAQTCLAGQRCPGRGSTALAIEPFRGHPAENLLRRSARPATLRGCGKSAVPDFRDTYGSAVHPAVRSRTAGFP